MEACMKEEKPTEAEKDAEGQKEKKSIEEVDH